MIILLTEHQPGIIQSVQNHLQSRYGITAAEVSTRYIRDLPRKDDGYSIAHLKQKCITDYYPLKSQCLYIDDISNHSTIADVIASEHITCTVTWTDDIRVAQEWLTGIEQTYDTIAVDFESRDLTLPQFNELTMVTLGWNATKSVVIVFKDTAIRDLVLNWLVTTKCRQVYHNALFDTRFLIYHTGKLPHNIEDSQLLAAVYHNHVNPDKRKTGLKELAKYPYLDWASDKSSFDLYVDSSEYINPNLHYVGSNPTPYIYNLPLIYYCGIDEMATYATFTKYDFESAHPHHWIMQTSEPRHNTEQFNQRYYYDFILKPAIPVIVEMLNTGQAIDLEQVHKLSEQVELIKQQCIDKINSYQIIQDFHKTVDQERIDKFLEPVKRALTKPKFTGYQSNPKMRAYVVNYLIGTSFDTLSDKELKSLDNPLLQPLIDKHYDDPDIIAACTQFAIDKANQQNIDNNRIDKINNPEKYITIGFNPWNYSQLKQMWIAFGLESDEVSKDTGEMSFSSPILKELVKTTSGDVQEIIELYLEIAESKNLITTTIPKYFGSSIDGRLFMSLRLMGTISGRLSGKAAKMDDDIKRHQTGANGVTQPASSSAFAKPVKKLFIAPPGKVLCYVDYNGLENHISAILTKDPTKIGILKGEFEDMHTLHACYFFKQEIEEKFNLSLEPITQEVVSTLFHNKEFKSIRNRGKPVTFATDYGAYPPKLAKSAGCSLEEAEGMFNRYHNELYKSVTEFREDYVFPVAKQQGYLHLNYGLRLYSDNPKQDIRTLFNSNFQGYTLLTQIAAVEFHKLIYANNLQDRVKGVSIIHDSLTYEVDEDPELIQWVNNNLIPLMCKDFVNDQVVPLRAELDICYNLADTTTLPNNADLATIEAKLATLKE